jgi:hypothetical protein
MIETRHGESRNAFSEKLYVSLALKIRVSRNGARDSAIAFDTAR